MQADFATDLHYTTVARQRLDRSFYPTMADSERFVVLDGSMGALWMQRYGHIDVVMQSKRGGAVTIEEKIVRWPGYPYDAMTLETHSDLRRNPDDLIGDGWINVSQADILLYAFEQADGSLMVWAFDLPKLKMWFCPRCDQYRIADTENAGYTTRCRIVPLADVPERCIKIRARGV